MKLYCWATNEKLTKTVSGNEKIEFVLNGSGKEKPAYKDLLRIKFYLDEGKPVLSITGSQEFDIRDWRKLKAE